MTDDKRILEILNREPKSAEDVVLQAYQLGRLAGRNESKTFIPPVEYERLHEFIAGKTEKLILRLRTIWNESLRQETYAGF